MDKTILLNFASRSRPSKFESVIENLMKMITSDKYLIVAKIDTDDPYFMNYMAIIADLPYNIIAKPGRSTGKLSAVNRDIPKEGWDIIVDVSDDFVFTKKGFDQIIRDNCGPDDYLHFPEPFVMKQVQRRRNESISVMYCAGKAYFDRTGYVYNPEYRSLFADNEGTAVAKLLGRHKFIDEEIFYHHHPSAGHGKADDQLKYTESFWDIDKLTYNKRKAVNFGL